MISGNLRTRWAKCFFCLTTLGQDKSRKARNNRIKLKFEIIFNYLLQEEQKQNGSLLQSILEELRSPAGSNLVQFCSKCESHITKVSELHKELEVIQMKLIDILKHVRSTIVDASRKDDVGITFTGNNTFNNEKLDDPQLQVPSPESDVQQDTGSTSSTTTRKVEYLFFTDEASANSNLPRLNLSDAFQAAVVMRNQELFHIPFVYLERCTTFRPVVDPNLSSHEIGDTTCLTEDVDNDPLREAEEPDDFFPNSDDNNDSSFNEDHMEQKSDVSEDEYLSPSKKKKRKKNFVVKKPTRNLFGSKSLIVACDSCPFIAAGPRRRYHMSHHLLKHETDEKFLQCPHCPAHEGFSGEQLYNLHLSFHEVTSRCEYCQGDIIDFDLAQHYRSHLDTVYRCQTCTFSSPSLESYLKHAFLYRTTVKCYICSAKFSVRSEFRSHLREEHGVVEKFSCDFESCGESYLSKSQLQSHRRTHTNPYACDCQESCDCEVSRTGETILYGGDSCPPTDIVKIEPLEHLEVEVCGDNESWLPENYDDSSHAGEVNLYRCKNEEGAVRQRKLLKRLFESKINTSDADGSSVLRKRRRRSREKLLLKSDSLEAEDVEDNDSDDPWLPENDSNSASSTLISDEDETRKKLADPDFSEDNEYKPSQHRKLKKIYVQPEGQKSDPSKDDEYEAFPHRKCRNKSVDREPKKHTADNFNVAKRTRNSRGNTIFDRNTGTLANKVEPVEEIDKSEPLEAEDFEDSNHPWVPENGSCSSFSEDENIVGDKVHPELREEQEPAQRYKRKRKSGHSKPKTDHINGKKKIRKSNEKSVFACDTCQFKTELCPYFTHHLLKHEKTEKTLKCPHCPMHEGFAGKQLYNLHLSFHEEKSNCQYCKNDIVYFDLAEHYRKHVDTVYQCRTCLHPATSTDQYLRHLDLFRIPILNCHLCSENFSEWSKFLDHLHVVHGVSEMILCDFPGCDKKFLDQRALNSHKKVHITITCEEPCICEVCGRAFKLRSSLSRHRKEHHLKGPDVKGKHPVEGQTKIRNAECDQCEQKFRRTADVLRHKIRDHGASKFQCEQCAKMFVTTIALRDHIRSVHEGVRYPCTFCDKDFDNRLKLKRHTRRHRTPAEVTCTICEKVLATHPSLLKHMTIKHNIQDADTNK